MRVGGEIGENWRTKGRNLRGKGQCGRGKWENVKERGNN